MPPAHRLYPAATIALLLALLAGVFLLVDPRASVEEDFFFAPDDPQLEELREIRERYPSGDQIVLRLRLDEPSGERLLQETASLERALEALAQVEDARSIASERRESPLWSRIFQSAGDSSTSILVQAREGADPSALTDGILQLARARSGEGSVVLASGATLVVELIRRSLSRDLITFSLASLLAFGLIALFVYRNGWLVAGALASCLAASAISVLVIAWSGGGLSLLTANIVAIVFVLTLSHTVFITANWRADPGTDPLARTRRAVLRTIRPSAWCAATTLLGFSSLHLASAKPLRELGSAGAVGTAVAFLAAYLALPAWLTIAGRSATGPQIEKPRRMPGLLLRAREALRALPVWLRRTSRAAALVLFAGAALFLAASISRLDTDPSLLRYFDPRGAVHPGLRAIDARHGSSSLFFAVEDSARERLDSPASYEKLWALQEALEADAETGVVTSPAPIIAHARELPLAGLLPLPLLVSLMEREELGGAGRGYVREDRREALFSILMREGAREGSRAETIDRLQATASDFGLRVRARGGMYELQGQLGELLRESLRTGLLGLFALLLPVAWMVSGSLRAAATVLLCLALAPVATLGAFGALSIPLDIVSSPAAMLAPAIGVDAMLHLAYRARTLGSPGKAAWRAARDALARPVLTTAAILCGGFGLFALSDFPPTRRFGFAIIAGVAAATAAALGALPGLLSKRPAARAISTARASESAPPARRP